MLTLENPKKPWLNFYTPNKEDEETLRNAPAPPSIPQHAKDFLAHAQGKVLFHYSITC